jgi:hypothetical protein
MLLLTSDASSSVKCRPSIGATDTRNASKAAITVLDCRKNFSSIVVLQWFVFGVTNGGYKYGNEGTYYKALRYVIDGAFPIIN